MPWQSLPSINRRKNLTPRYATDGHPIAPTGSVLRQVRSVVTTSQGKKAEFLPMIWSRMRPLAFWRPSSGHSPPKCGASLPPQSHRNVIGFARKPFSVQSAEDRLHGPTPLVGGYGPLAPYACSRLHADAVRD